MSAMEMSQMVVQAMWDRDSPLKQIPHFTPEVIAAVNEYGIKDIFELMEAFSGKDAGTLIKRTSLDNKQLAQAADFTNNKYQNLELVFEVEDKENITAGSPSYLKIKIEREVDDDGDDEEEEEDAKKGRAEPDITVHAPFYPNKKIENWWLVVGGKGNSLLAIKRVTIGRKLELRLEYVVPTPGKHELTLYLMSDSYVGVDQDPTFTVEAAEGMDEDEDEEEEDDE